VTKLETIMTYLAQLHKLHMLRVGYRD